MNMKNKLYIIDGKTYLSHINDEVHLYGLLHQLAFLAGRIKDEEDVFHVLDAAKRYGEIAEEKFQGWGIPGRYLVFGDPKDLKDLMAKELAEATPVPVEEPKPKKYKDEYIIPGYGFRMLVGDIHHLIVLYYSLARRLSEAETEKDFLRLKKKAGGYEKVLKKLFRSLGLPEDSNAAQDILEESIIRRHNLVRLEDVEEPQDEGFVFSMFGREIHTGWSDSAVSYLLVGLTVLGVVLLAAVIVLFKNLFQKKQVDPAEVQVPEYVKVDLLTPNPYSRPQKPLEEVRGIVVHYVANPCSTARENRSYFEQLKDQTGENATSASSHFVIGLEGEVVQCVPLTEVAYASNHRNSDTISIECCHPDETGKFYDSTYESLVELCAYFCTEFKLKPEDVIRHYDVTGKICPKYFVDHEDAWDQFHKDVEQAMKKK